MLPSAQPVSDPTPPTPLLGRHAGYLLTKSAYKAAWAIFGREMNRTVSHRFRTYKPLEQGGDLVSHLLVEHTGLQLGLQEARMAIEAK